MKRTIATAFLLLALCGVSFAPIVFIIDAPQDDPKARAGVRDRPELKPFQTAYLDLLTTRLEALKAGEVARIFGPNLATNTNWWGNAADGVGKPSGPELVQHPANLVLPVFAPGMAGLGGIHSSDPAENKHHTDLHSIDEIGYAEFYYGADGQTVESALIYFRADDKFVPLKSTNDFSRRLRWDQTKLDALKTWLDKHTSSRGPAGGMRWLHLAAVLTVSVFLPLLFCWRFKLNLPPA